MVNPFFILKNQGVIIMNVFNKIFDKKISKNIGVILKEFPFPIIQITDTVDSIMNICRDINSDKLIQEKELAEIEAKVNIYTEYTNFHKDTLNKGYELEKKELELIQIITSKIVTLFEIVEILDENSPKFLIYIEQINRYQKILEKIVESTGKYFNEKVIEASRIDIPEFIRYTEIGKHESRKKLNNMKEAEYV